MELIKNNHKVKGAYVWYESEIREITKSDIEIGSDLILDRLVRVKRRDVTLVRVGDFVTIKKSLVNVLPDRTTFGKQKITHIRANGLIGTNKDANELDDSNYRHFQKWVDQREETKR